MAIDYYNYLGTEDITPAQKKEEFYKLGCEVTVSSSNEQSYILLSGLDENFEKSVELFETLLAQVTPDEEALTNLKMDVMKKRADAKLNKQTILYRGMSNYAKYGPKNPFTNRLSDDEIVNITSDELITKIKDLTSYEHRVLYYGPRSFEDATTAIESLHPVKDELITIGKDNDFEELEINKTSVFIVDYDMKQAEILMLSKAEKFNAENMPLIKLHNEYFGGSMGSIVFQTLRESKALAYSVYSSYTTPRESDKSHYVMAYIGTQADKLKEAMLGMNELLDKLPEVGANLENAKDAVTQKIRTERITKDRVLFNYESAKRLGYNYDSRKDVFEQINNFNLSDLTEFHNAHMSNNEYSILVLGNKDDLDIDALKEYGQVTFLTLEDIFGY